LWFLIFRANLLFFPDTAKHFAFFLFGDVKMDGEERGLSRQRADRYLQQAAKKQPKGKKIVLREWNYT